MANTLSKLKPLPEYINGFRTIKCQGYDKNRRVRWATVECKVCKRIYEVDPNKLQYRKHCGCIKSGRIVNRYRAIYPKLNNLYKDMILRCYNKKRLCYNNYGGRGITVCDEWRADSNVFCKWALENGYEENLSIDRIDNNLGYYPKNCRWTTITEQNRNKRNVKLTLDLAKEIRLSDAQISYLEKKYGVDRETIRQIKDNKSWREN